MEFKLPTRKIQSIGYSFYISIPPLWVENQGLTKGDCVKLSLNENKLILEAQNEKTNTTTGKTNSEGIKGSDGVDKK